MPKLDKKFFQKTSKIDGDFVAGKTQDPWIDETALIAVPLPDADRIWTPLIDLLQELKDLHFPFDRDHGMGDDRYLVAPLTGEIGGRRRGSEVFRVEGIELCGATESARPLTMPRFHLQELKGRLKAHWAVSVSGSWRVTFRFEDGAAFDVDYEAYR